MNSAPSEKMMLLKKNRVNMKGDKKLTNKAIKLRDADHEGIREKNMFSKFSSLAFRLFVGLAICCLSIFLVSSPNLLLAQTGSTLRISPASGTVSQGVPATYSIFLDIESGESYGAGSYSFSYDSATLNLNSFTLNPNLFGVVNSNTPGTVLFNVVAPAGETGTLLLGTAEMTAVSSDSFSLILGLTDPPVDTVGSELPNLTIQNAAGTVGNDGPATIFVSSTTAGTANGVTFTDEDIIAYDIVSGTWSRHFDGSDVGLSGDALRDIDAFTILDDGSILLSISGPSTIPNVGAIDDSDIVRFIPTKIGPKTEGSYEMYFDGSDVGLDTDKEDIDGIAVLPDGRIIISTLGFAQTTKQFGNTLNSLDEDLIAFTPTSLGSNTSGYFSLYADGSDFGLEASTEDVWGIAISTDGGDVYLNPAWGFDTGLITGDIADFFVCEDVTVGSVASCGSQSLTFDGSISGIGSEYLDGIHVGFD